MDVLHSPFIFALLSGFAAVPLPIHPDKVISLPGAPLHPEFNLFSGYLNGSSNGTSIPIFYVLAESIRVAPSSAPLVVWFNGGPGGSSLAGFFKEHGPYLITEKGDSLTYNEFSWNQYANVIYLEIPLGVGFSQNYNRDMLLNNNDTAEANYNAIKDFMTRVHPNYADRDYYLSGQSYAGVFIPYFARRILVGIDSEEMENDKFKGFAIGNPTIDNLSKFLLQSLKYNSYGLVPLNVTGKILENWLKYERGEELTQDDVDEIAPILYNQIVDGYIGLNSPVHYNFVEHCYNETYSNEVYHVSTDKKSIACYFKTAMESFLNRIDVQIALHVANVTMNEGSFDWHIFNKNISALFARHVEVLPIYDDIFARLNGSSFRVLIYNGDTDVMLPSTHALLNVAKIAAANSFTDQGFDRAWRFYGDFAGVRTGYKKGKMTMDVLTVRGAGHSVPADLPAQAFQMINNFLSTEENEDIDYSKPIRKH